MSARRLASERPEASFGKVVRVREGLVALAREVAAELVHLLCGHALAKLVLGRTTIIIITIFIMISAARITQIMSISVGCVCVLRGLGGRIRQWGRGHK